MHTYTAIALLSLLGITLSASAARYFERLVELTQSQKGDRSPERGSGRREFAQHDLYTHYILA
ncbi:MAG: hypothetical protein EAZ23_26185 [Oscillatoriales cyanobacterium]|nr:MAG: hypothetical protein EAZ23_26185 [Oscillatoriales cyanobacterium]